MKLSVLFPRVLGGLAIALVASSFSIAQEDVGPAGPLVPYSQNFDSIPLGTASDVKDTSLFDADPWRVFGNVSEANLANGDPGAYAYGYGPFFAPNNIDGGAFGVGFSVVASGEPTTSGSNYLNTFSDYNNGDHRNGTNRVLNAVIYQDRAVTTADVGGIWDFQFDYRNATDGFGVADDTTGVSSANAFVKVLDSVGGSFQPVGEIQALDTSSATADFQRGSILFEITSDHVGQLLQFGFENFASNDSPSGVYYDTLSFAIQSDDVLGDFDGDGDVDLADLDRYNGNLDQAATGLLADLDLTDDGQVTDADFALHYGQLVETSNGGKGTFQGDLNLDGKVDIFGDGFTFLENIGNAATSWGEGDFNADGQVDIFGDGFALLNNIGNDNGGGAAGAPATSAVPEPSSMLLTSLLVGATALRRRRG